MNYLTVHDAIKQIWNYYDQKGLYTATSRTSLTRPRVVYLTKSFEIDICNKENIDNDGLNILIPDLDFAYKVLSNLSRKTIEQCKTDSKILFENNRVDTTKDLFLSIRIVPQ